jgi:hypothetical protein
VGACSCSAPYLSYVTIMNTLRENKIRYSIYILSAFSILFSNFTAANCNSLIDYETRKLRSSEAYQGKVIVMVNTVSQCGYTPQFESLEELHQRQCRLGKLIESIGP